MINSNNIDAIILNAFQEDMPYGDITAEAIIDSKHVSKAELIAKSEGVLCGMDVFVRVFSLLGDVEVKVIKKDGELIQNQDRVALIEGNTRNILAGERTALNIIQRMSGIATHTRKAVEKVQHTECTVVDTRKTTPGFRVLEKAAVLCGGGSNHRNGLSDGILIKDNHITAAGGVAEAIAQVRKNASHVHRIEIEVESIQMVNEAMDAGADILLLDNMTLEQMKESVEIVNSRALTEASGNMTLERIAAVAETGVDLISMGSIIYNSDVVDLSLKFL